MVDMLVMILIRLLLMISIYEKVIIIENFFII